MAAPMTHAISKRRGQGEDSIYWDATKNRYVGAVSLGFSPVGTRVRKKVTGRTKTEVRDKLRDLHKQVEGGLRPRRRYTVEDALEDWLAHGLDGVSARTVTLYRRTIAKALREELGSVRLTELTAADVQARWRRDCLRGRRRSRTTCWSGRSGTPSGTTWPDVTLRRWSSRRRGSRAGGRRSR